MEACFTYPACDVNLTKRFVGCTKHRHNAGMRHLMCRPNHVPAASGFRKTELYTAKMKITSIFCSYSTVHGREKALSFVTPCWSDVLLGITDERDIHTYRRLFVGRRARLENSCRVSLEKLMYWFRNRIVNVGSRWCRVLVNAGSNQTMVWRPYFVRALNEKVKWCRIIYIFPHRNIKPAT